jgi:hypothetical protein
VKLFEVFWEQVVELIKVSFLTHLGFRRLSHDVDRPDPTYLSKMSPHCSSR